MKSGKDRQEGFLHPRLETMGPAERETYLSGKLKSVLKAAYRSSGPYREKFKALKIKPEDLRALKDLESFPITQRQELLSRQKADPPFGGFVTLPPEKLRRIYISPGLIFGPGERDFRDTRWAEALYAGGFRAGDLALNTFNYQLWAFAFILDESLNQLKCTTIPAGSGNTQMQIRIMRALKVNAFLGTPSYLMDLAQRGEDMGLLPARDLSLEIGFVSAEMLPESLRKRLEEKIGLTLTQAYGTVDVGCLGYECPAKTGLHIPSDIIVEVVDPETGKAVPPGAPGEIVATHFNPVMPLIRFATGDLSILQPSPCTCGRTSSRLVKILGRIDQATKVQGLFIHPWQTDEVASRFSQVAKYQLVITRRDHHDELVYFVELKDDVTDPAFIQRGLESALKEILHQESRVEILKKGSIPEWHKKIEDRRSWD